MSSSMKNEIEQIDQKIEVKHKDLNDRISNLKKIEGTSESTNKIRKTWVDVVANSGTLPFSKQQLEMSILLTMEKEDEERRSKKIVIFGIPRSDKEAGSERQREDFERVQPVRKIPESVEERRESSSEQRIENGVNNPRGYSQENRRNDYEHERERGWDGNGHQRERQPQGPLQRNPIKIVSFRVQGEEVIRLGYGVL
ncbi:unnamed protein product [Brachionus calyciflorus]|uniref:Uncharacterized protein n=1 Tax=Brachionus calyciflorus TaxID=104777 RepID=A0A814JK22_9BILA|nr:unnamed protein product [Brachionus calyciflorus]